MAERKKDKLAVRRENQERAFENPQALAQGVASIPRRIARYASTSTPSQVLSDVGGLARATYQSAKEDPAGFIGDAIFSPFAAMRDFGDIRARARQLRAAGRNAEAEKLEAMTGAILASAIPIVGRAPAAAVRSAERATVRGAERSALAVKAPAVIKARSGTAKATAADVLAEAGSKGKKQSYADWRVKNPESGTILDMSRLSEVPNVPQTQLPRTVPPRGPSPRIVEALSRPEVERGINETVERGIEGGGLQWYNTDPLRERMVSLVPADQLDSRYAQLMDIVAATSPRARVPNNIRTAAYYNYLQSQGLPIPEKPAAGYGSVAQKLHTQNVRDVTGAGGWDVFKNPKPASFSTNLQGNQQNVTIDTHNFRLPGILSQDPRFLATSIVPEKGAEPLRPRQWVEEGTLSLEDALQRPAYWESKPNANEYGYYEQWQQDQAKKMGISPAQYQASMWLGGGEETGLASAAEPFVGTFEARVRYTADRLGLDPGKVLEQVLKGEIPLLAEGGSVDLERLSRKYA